MSKIETLPIFNPLLLPDFYHPGVLVAGVDEVGRGALFGPVVAAAVVLPISVMPELASLGVKDSKQLSARQRSALVPQIQRLARSHQIGYATAQEIDHLDILQASLLAMKRAIARLQVQPTVCLVDGNQTIPGLPIAQKSLIKGDRRSPVIAAASIIAKVWRDELIVRFAQKYPEYDLAANKGYGTPTHRLALKYYGCSPQHRLSFGPCRVKD
jgi:ribonuclease HII